MSSRASRLRLPPRKTAVGRADLLWLVHAQSADEAFMNAALLGFVYHDDPEEESARPPPAGAPAPAAGAPAPPAAAAQHARHFAVVEAQRSAAGETPAGDEATASDAGSVYTSFTGDGRAPPRLALSPPRRLAVFLNQTLRTPRRGRTIDSARLLVDLARHRLPARLPRCVQLHWSGQAALVIDLSLASAPLHGDLIELAEQAHALSGGRLPVYAHAPARGWLVRLPGSKPEWAATDSETLRRARHWLIAGAGGSRAGSGRFAGGLGELCRAHAAAGGRLTLLGGGLPDDGVLRLPARNCRCVAWEHGGRLRAERSAARWLVDEVALARLLAALSLAVVVEPELLRALRLALGVSTAGELAAWNHTDSEPCLLATQLRRERLADYRRKLLDEALPLRRRLAKIIARRHAGESLLIRLEEQALAADLAQFGASQAGERWAQAVRTLQRAAHGEADAEVGAAAGELAAYLGRCGRRAHAALWRGVPQLADAYVIARRQQLQAGEAIPAGLPSESLERHLAPPGSRPAARRWYLLQQGQNLLLAGEGPPVDAFVLAEGAAATGLDVQTPGQGRQWHPPPQPGEIVVLGDKHAAGVDGAWIVGSARERFVVRELPRPAWALACGRDGQGLYALAPSPLGAPARLYWRPDEAVAALWPPPANGFSASPCSLAPNVSLGADLSYGLYAEVTIAGVVQRLRWIAAGEFWMGSPAGEAGRYDDEGPRHRVRISQGFWLADTACTQALWLAVMGSNPSRFSDEAAKPVEQVSWNDVQEFLQRVEKRLPGVRARLPREAEWEYACRAGSETAYAWGDEISPDQAPSRDAKARRFRRHSRLGDVRRQTSAVAAKAAGKGPRPARPCYALPSVASQERQGFEWPSSKDSASSVSVCCAMSRWARPMDRLRGSR